MFFRRKEAATKRSSVFSKIGVLTTLVLLLLIPVLAVGIWQDWVNISADATQGDWNVKFTIDTGEIQEDVEKVNPPEAPLFQ